MVCKTPIFVVALRRRLIDCFLLPMDGFFLIESEALPLYITSLDLGVAFFFPSDNTAPSPRAGCETLTHCRCQNRTIT